MPHRRERARDTPRNQRFGGLVSESPGQGRRRVNRPDQRSCANYDAGVARAASPFVSTDRAPVATTNETRSVGRGIDRGEANIDAESVNYVSDRTLACAAQSGTGARQAPSSSARSLKRSIGRRFRAAPGDLEPDRSAVMPPPLALQVDDKNVNVLRCGRLSFAAAAIRALATPYRVLLATGALPSARVAMNIAALLSVRTAPPAVPATDVRRRWNHPVIRVKDE